MKRATLLLFILMTSMYPLSSASSAKELSLERFEGIYEPSGVAQLPGGEVVIIEDEKNVPLWIMEPKWKKKRLILAVKQRLEIKGYSYDDLEGIEVGKDGKVFVITSHSLKGDKRKETRERLLKLQLLSGTAKTETGKNLFSAIAASIGGGGEHSHAINIEALSFDNDKEHILLGLRSPLDEDKAIVLEVMNPEEYFTKGKAPEVRKRASLPIKGGIRAMCFDPLGKKFILASELGEKKGKQSVLWTWDGTSEKVERLQIPGLNEVKNVEGVSLLRWNTKNYLLLVCDDGNRKKNKGAYYLIVEYKSK